MVFVEGLGSREEWWFAAMGKRHLEAAAASVAESPGHGPGAVAASTPARPSTPSSSSMASLKPGRRTVRGREGCVSGVRLGG